MSETATLAGGCFWCIEAVFRRLTGVVGVISGYSGGTAPQPTYEQVCSGRTGHTEAVQVVFDPALISYRDLVHIFFHVHDPTTPNRQGPDVGSQYRSAIFYENPEQQATAEEVRSEIEQSGLWERPLVTEIAPLTAFYPAEEYHQDFYRRNPEQLYCAINIPPKLGKLEEFCRARGISMKD